ncbi:hypothetical protein PtB15_6B826 [Puccinia triticina]|nr:hypothetical protein PtB15_6B826 [Puccinia triticina]
MSAEKCSPSRHLLKLPRTHLDQKRDCCKYAAGGVSYRSIGGGSSVIMDHIYNFALRLLILLASSTVVTAIIKGVNPANPPYQTMKGQYGYNQCGTGASADSRCQNVHIKSATDFCIFGPPRFAGVSETEREAVSYCTQPTHGTRLIPPGTFSSLHYV